MCICFVSIVFTNKVNVAALHTCIVAIELTMLFLFIQCYGALKMNQREHMCHGMTIVTTRTLLGWKGQ